MTPVTPPKLNHSRSPKSPKGKCSPKLSKPSSFIGGPISSVGHGALYKFTSTENRLIKWILEQHGFKEAQGDGNVLIAQDYLEKQDRKAQFTSLVGNIPKFISNNEVPLIWSSSTVKSSVY